MSNKTETHAQAPLPTSDKKDRSFPEVDINLSRDEIYSDLITVLQGLYGRFDEAVVDYWITSLPSKWKSDVGQPEGTVFQTDLGKLSTADAVALQKMYEIEVHNRLTDIRVQAGALPRLKEVREKLRAYLGAAPNPDILFLRIDTSGGATPTVKRSDTAIFRKYEDLSISRRAKKYGLIALKSNPVLWRAYGNPITGDAPWAYLESDVYFTVAKNATENRPAAMQPTWNANLQLTVGEEIERRLKGVRGRYTLRGEQVVDRCMDTTDQFRNRKLAHEGSITGHYATLDLKSASVTLTRTVLSQILPEDWFNLLDDLRCESTEIYGHRVPLAQFMSTGNGYTFPLQTAIFGAILSVCCGTVRDGYKEYEVYSAYGDDIVIPTESFKEVTELLTSYGLIPNLKKSFSSGPFRESCGGYYYEGNYIRPLYIPMNWGLIDQLSFLNQLKFFAHRCTGMQGLLIDFRDTYEKLRKKLYQSYPLSNSYVPPYMSGSGIVRDPDDNLQLFQFSWTADGDYRIGRRYEYNGEMVRDGIFEVRAQTISRVYQNSLVPLPKSSIQMYFNLRDDKLTKLYQVYSETGFDTSRVPTDRFESKASYLLSSDNWYRLGQWCEVATLRNTVTEPYFPRDQRVDWKAISRDHPAYFSGNGYSPSETECTIGEDEARQLRRKGFRI